MHKRNAITLLLGFVVCVVAFGLVLRSDSVSVQAQGAEETPQAMAEEELINQGEMLYTNYCSTCHQAEGQGVQGGAGVYVAPLDGNNLVTGVPDAVILLVLEGYGPMPGFQNDFSHEELAAVISYIRNAWQNEASVVQPEAVSEVASRQAD